MGMTHMISKEQQSAFRAVALYLNKQEEADWFPTSWRRGETMTEWITEKNGETIVRTCCFSPPGCHPVGCGVKLHIKDGELVKLEGDTEHYITKGSLCPRALSLKEYIYHPDRLTHPVKRAREDRGKDKWEACSWDEAIEIIYENWKKITDQYGPESVIVFGGTGRQGAGYYPLYANLVFGTPNSCYAQSGESCYMPRMAFSAYCLGLTMPDIDNASKFADRYDHPGWEAPKYICLWGKEPLKSNPDGFYGHSIIEMMRNFGTKIICIDPRTTWLGSRSDEVVKLRPGSDAALAMAFLNVIINEDLYDHEFVEKWVWGFEELAERVQAMPPSLAAEICWVPEQQIIRVARKLADRPVSMGWGLAIDQSTNGAQAAQCLIAITAITGNYDIPGGTTLGRFAQSAFATPDQIARSAGIISDECWNKRIGNETSPAVNSVFGSADPDDLLDCLESDEPYPLRMCMFHSSNPIGPAISSCPQRWYKALQEKMEFCCATETFHNASTMALADVVLPLSTWAEHDAVVNTNYSLNISQWGCINKAITVGDTKSEIEIMMLLGRRFHPEYWSQFEDAQDYLVKTEQVPNNMTWEEFQSAVSVPSEEEYRKYEKGQLRPDGQVGFMTATGRVELYSVNFEMYGDDPLPYFVEPAYSPYSQPELSKEFPLVLTTGARTFASFHSEHRQLKTLRQIVDQPEFELHPDTATELGLKEGDWCWIETPFGRCRQRLHITICIDPRVTHAMHGWWFPEEDPEVPHLYGNFRSNINVTMPHHVNGPLGFGDCFKSMICKVYKDTETE